MTPSLVVGPLRGYRYWQVKWHGDQPVLRSLYRSTIWPAEGPLRATCEKRPGSLASWVRSLLSSRAETHSTPQWGCGCGIYALTRLDTDEPLEMSPQVYQRGLFERVVHVVGVVQLWGRVIQHEQGYRAEYARPLRVLTVPSHARVSRSASHDIASLLDAVAQRYSIQLVTRVEELNSAA